MNVGAFLLLYTGYTHAFYDFSSRAGNFYRLHGEIFSRVSANWAEFQAGVKISPCNRNVNF